MSHPSQDGEVSAILRAVDSIEPLMVGTTSARFVATGSVTNGHFGLFRWDMSAQVGGAAPHYHRTFTESFYVLSGSVRLLFTPGPPREKYFEELAEIRASGRALSGDEWTDLYSRHDQYMVG